MPARHVLLFNNQSNTMYCKFTGSSGMATLALREPVAQPTVYLMCIWLLADNH